MQLTGIQNSWTEQSEYEKTLKTADNPSPKSILLPTINYFQHLVLLVFFWATFFHVMSLTCFLILMLTVKVEPDFQYHFGECIWVKQAKSLCPLSLQYLQNLATVRR